MSIKMVRLDDIRSLAELQRNTRAHIERLKREGGPELLTVNGQAEVVVQDARSYQKLLDRATKARCNGWIMCRLILNDPSARASS